MYDNILNSINKENKYITFSKLSVNSIYKQIIIKMIKMFIVYKINISIIINIFL